MNQIRYSRQMLIAVLIEHQQMQDSSCLCGWAVLGMSHAEHVAACYELAMGGPS